MNLLELINFGSKELKYKEIKSYKLDSEILLSKTLGLKREEVLINLDQQINLKKEFEFKEMIKRRSLKEPLAYITNEKEFWSKNFQINKNTLIPRPETELMVEKLIKIYKNKSISVIDIGTGSGCILISILGELQGSLGVGIDISREALKIAKSNSEKYIKKEKIKFLRRSVNNIYNKKFDLVVSNPPYIDSKMIKNLDDDVKKFEPIIALDGGNDGLDLIKKVIYKAKEILKINGRLAIEIGNGQYKKVSKILVNNNFRIEINIKDYKENTRCLISKYYN